MRRHGQGAGQEVTLWRGNTYVGGTVGTVGRRGIRWPQRVLARLEISAALDRHTILGKRGGQHASAIVRLHQITLVPGADDPIAGTKLLHGDAIASITEQRT